MSGIVLIICAVVAVLGLIVVVALSARAAKSANDPLAVRIVGKASLAVGVVIGLGTLFQVSSMLVPGANVSMKVPVRGVGITQIDENVAESSAHLDSGWYSTATVESTSFGPSVLIPGAIGHLLVGAVLVMLCMVVWVVCRRLLAGAPFASAVSRISIATAVVTLVAGVIGQVLLSISTSFASMQLFPAHSSSAGTTPESPTGDLAIEVTLWPIAVAFVLTVFATIVKFGANVQTHRDELKYETDGLI